MKAGVVYAREDIRYEEINKPVPQKGQVLIKVKYTGICGSDIPRVNGDACHFFPNVLGHEFSGTIEAIGDSVVGVEPGNRVAGVPLVPCMKCEDCQKGNYSLCKDIIEDSKIIYGSGIWFEPNEYKPTEKYGGFYAYRNGKEVVVTYDRNTPEYDYFNREFYLVAKEAEEQVYLQLIKYLNWWVKFLRCLKNRKVSRVA